MLVDEAAAYLSMSAWTLREAARRGEVPCFKPPGRRRVLFKVAELDAWADGAELETVKLPKGGRRTRIKDSSSGRRGK